MFSNSSLGSIVLLKPGLSIHNVIGTGNGRIMKLLAGCMEGGQITGVIDKEYDLDDGVLPF